jgi:DNA-binding protein HU-beta
LPGQVKSLLRKSSEKQGFFHVVGDFILARSQQKVLMAAKSIALSTDKINPVKHTHYMAKSLSKSQLASEIAAKSGLTKKAGAEMLEHLAELAYKHAKNSFTLPGIGKLVLQNRKARLGRNPATGAPIQIPARKVVKFRVSKAAKDAILGAH